MWKNRFGPKEMRLDCKSLENRYNPHLPLDLKLQRPALACSHIAQKRTFLQVGMSVMVRPMARRRGNSTWSSGRLAEIRPRGPTGFEQQVQRLGLNEQTCAASRELKQWCERNKDSHYIPEWLLKRWGMSVDPNVSS